MWIFRCIATLALLLSSVLALPALGDPLELQGEAQRGETLVHQFEHDGRHFQLRFLPRAGGWAIWIGDPMKRDRNYIVPATPPYRGINPAVVEGWHFRNADNTGPNKAGAGHVNAPGRIREFAIVLDSGGYQRAREALEILMWPDGHEETEIRAAEEVLSQVPKTQVTLEIDALELGNLIEGQQPWIERMAFRLRIELP